MSRWRVPTRCGTSEPAETLCAGKTSSRRASHAYELRKSGEEARCLGLGNRHLLTATQPWTPACPTARWSFVEGVLDSAGCRHHGLRLLLCGDCLVEDALCSFLHRTLHTQGP